MLASPDKNLPTIAQIHQQLSAALATIARDNAALEARLLVALALKIDSFAVITQRQRRITPHEALAIDALVVQRLAGTPIDRLRGSKEFWSLSFELNESCLSPRADSEVMIELAVQVAQKFASKLDSESLRSPNKCNDKLRVLDLGSGSGCLAISLLHELPDAQAVLLDIAWNASRQSAKNASRLLDDGRTMSIVGDWTAPIKGNSFDVILCNPPYISHEELEQLAPEVLDHDPRLALDGGPDGLQEYSKLLDGTYRCLRDGGTLLLELNPTMPQRIVEMVKRAGFSSPQVHQDLAGRPRIVRATKYIC